MNPSSVIGREEEIATISRLFASERSEFLAIYGRRRVGKSFLIEEALENKFSFVAVGLYQKIDHDNPEKVESYRQKQLAHFHNSLVEYGLSKTNPAPNSWMEALNLLKKLLQSKRARRKVVFIDELPWLAGPQSAELLAELGHFWNSWARKRKDIFLIVCGSATSWMVDNVMRDYGGLYGRITESIFLKPFTLAECERYWAKRGFHLSRYEIALTYMVIGGVPYYMDSIRPDRTMADNINAIYFDKDKARQEFKDVYTGLYSTSETYINVIRQLGKRFYGMTRDELLNAVDKKGGGTFTDVLENLMDSGIMETPDDAVIFLNFHHRFQIHIGNTGRLPLQGEKQVQIFLPVFSSPNLPKTFPDRRNGIQYTEIIAEGAAGIAAVRFPDSAETGAKQAGAAAGREALLRPDEKGAGTGPQLLQAGNFGQKCLEAGFCHPLDLGKNRQGYFLLSAAQWLVLGESSEKSGPLEGILLGNVHMSLSFHKYYG